MEKQVLEFTLETKWELVIFSFNNETGFMSDNKIDLKKKLSPEEIYEKVLSIENFARTNLKGNFRQIIWKYYVIESEKMTDDRSKFGHENKSSEKIIGYYIPVTYVRGFIHSNEPGKIMIPGSWKMDPFSEELPEEFELNVFTDEKLSKLPSFAFK